MAGEPSPQRILVPQTPSSIWQGRSIRLRAIEPSDWPVYFAWNRDDDQARGVDCLHFPQSAEAVRQWAQQEADRGGDGDAFRFVIEDAYGEVVGNLNTHGCDPRVGAFSYGITIKQEHRRRGYAAEAIALVLRFYFQELRYQKVTVRVFSFNDASRALHERLGFVLEGRIRRTVFTAGQFHDEVIYGLTAEEFASHVSSRSLP
ncbi:MAG: GNAT family protein [Thermomicrobiales bacterium]